MMMAEETYTATGYSFAAMRDGECSHACVVIHLERPTTGPEIQARAMELCKIAFPPDKGWYEHHVVIAPFNGVPTLAHVAVQQDGTSRH